MDNLNLGPWITVKAVVPLKRCYYQSTRNLPTVAIYGHIERQAREKHRSRKCKGEVKPNPWRVFTRTSLKLVEEI